MEYPTVLLPDTSPHIQKEENSEPEFFADLNLHRIIENLTTGKSEYSLSSFFWCLPNDILTVRYRQAIFRDLEHLSTFTAVKKFERQMRTVRERLLQSEKRYYSYQKASWFLDAVDAYCEAVNSLSTDLSSNDILSEGLLQFCGYLDQYRSSAAFLSLQEEARWIREHLAYIHYCIHITGNTVKVRSYDDEPDQSKEIEHIFERFKRGAAKSFLTDFIESPDMNHVEASILDCVAKLKPEVFGRLDAFYTKNGSFIDTTISLFDREIQFYVAYLEHLNVLRREGLQFCYPEIRENDATIRCEDGFDLALAYEEAIKRRPVVTNDFFMENNERAIVVSGPNQGGKTTFARMFGQMQYLAALGCPVPGSEASFPLIDRIFTHFEIVEDIGNLRGKLQDDLTRVKKILDQATEKSLIILNEIFSSTTLRDARFLAREIMSRILKIGAHCVCVTFLEEIADMDKAVVSMASTVSPDDPTIRTFKIVRKPPDGLAYALSIAEKYRLTYEGIMERITL